MFPDRSEIVEAVNPKLRTRPATFVSLQLLIR